MSELQTMTPVLALPSETQKKAPDAVSAVPRRKWISWLIWLVALHVPIAVGGYLVYRFYFAATAAPKVVALSGRIEGDDSAVAPKVTGRILEIRFREGDSVKAGEVIAILDDPQVHAREQQARDQAMAAEAQLSSAEQQIAVLNDQLKQTELQTNQATLDAEGRVNQAEAELSHAEAQLAQQEASLKLALFDRDAYTKLATDGAVSERQGKSAQTTAETQQALVAAARR